MFAEASCVKEEVRDFYDHYPYPPPVDSLEKYQRLWQDEQRRRAEHHLFWPAIPYQENQSILIAGCGTSQAAKHAMRWPGAQVTGIDVSATSVRCTEELKRKHNLNNLHVRQLAIEQVSELDASFDQIVCTGVLHHLADPDAGLRALRGVLKPEGAMHLMVYAPYGRAGIYLLQEFCKRIGIAANDAGDAGSDRVRSGHCRLDILWKSCFVRPPIFSTRRPLPMLSCIPRTAPTLSRSFWTSSRRQG